MASVNIVRKKTNRVQTGIKFRFDYWMLLAIGGLIRDRDVDGLQHHIRLRARAKRQRYLLLRAAIRCTWAWFSRDDDHHAV